MKIVTTTATCRECPNRRYYSGGQYECTAGGMSAPLIEGERMPDWCPLPSHPAEIAAMAQCALNNAQIVLRQARDEAQSATPERLRELIAIAADQVARV